MNILLNTLGDPIWQVLALIITLAAPVLIVAVLVLILALLSPEVHLAPRHQWLWTRITLLVCFSLFLVLSAGVVWFHRANAAPTPAPAVTQPS